MTIYSDHITIVEFEYSYERKRLTNDVIGKILC